jgi:hypothetical protein
MNVFKVSYDVRVGTTWLGGGNPNGWTSRNVLVRGDVREACSAVEREEMRTEHEGHPVEAVRIFRVELVATDVLCKPARKS